MVALRSLALVGAVSLLAPAFAGAQPPWSVDRSLAYDLGFERGQRAGIDDARRGDRYDFTDESDYRRGEVGYRPQYGDRQRFRGMFRSGYEAGYRRGYGTPFPVQGRGGYAGRPGYVNDRPGYGYGPDLAFERGYSDGYEAGLKDARRHDRPDPISEGRYRSGDHGYTRSYGPRDAYKNRYRMAFQEGYERGYADTRRYESRARTGWGLYFGFGR